MFCLKQLPRISCLAIRRASKAVQIFCTLTFLRTQWKIFFFFIATPQLKSWTMYTYIGSERNRERIFILFISILIYTKEATDYLVTWIHTWVCANTLKPFINNQLHLHIVWLSSTGWRKVSLYYTGLAAILSFITMNTNNVVRLAANPSPSLVQAQKYW